MRNCVPWAVALCWAAGVSLCARGATLFETHFEEAEGYDPRFTLIGQRGWTGSGTGGNGLWPVIPGLGQQAYVGIFPPVDTNEAVSVWHPINFTPPASAKIVQFSVAMQFHESTAGGHDEFRWAVYNQAEDRLFSIDFFTSDRRIFYELQDRQLHDTGWQFRLVQPGSAEVYELVIWMDFGRNTWTALLNGSVLAHGQKITQGNAPLNLGDIDAVWALENPGSPGNNAMVFDDYLVTTENAAAIPAVLENIGKNAKGNYEFRIYPQVGVRYSVDVTADFQTWESLLDFVANESTIVFEDTTSPRFPMGFYRLREIR